jgi:hypothetical protein
VPAALLAEWVHATETHLIPRWCRPLTCVLEPNQKQNTSEDWCVVKIRLVSDCERGVHGSL